MNLIGKPGVKYGLNVRKKKPAATALPARGGIFGDDDDEAEESVSEQVARLAAAKAREKHTERLVQEALEEDPSVFAYDEVVDAMGRERAQRTEQREQAKKNKAPKYIHLLMDKAKQRERELEIVRERRIHKEIEAEAEVYGDTEEFVTPAYKKHLLERNQWIEEQARRDAAEADVTKKKDLSAFYSNLLSANEAMGAEAPGGDKPNPPAPAPAAATSTSTSTSAAGDKEHSSSTKPAADTAVSPLTGEKRKRSESLADGERGDAEAPPASSTSTSSTTSTDAKQAEIEAARERALARAAAKRFKRT